MARHFSFFAILAATVSLCACTLTEIETAGPAPESEAATTSGEEGTITLHATIDNTKVCIDGSNYLYWQNGDKVWVNGAEYTICVTDGNATIPGVVAAESYTAIYPAGIVDGFADESHTQVNITVPEIQQYRVLDESQVLGLPVTAHSNDENLSFRCAASVLKVLVYNDSRKGADITPEYIDITPQTATENDEPFSGSYSLDMSSPYILAGGITKGAKEHTVLSFEGASQTIPYNGYKAFYITVPAFEHSRLSVTLYASDDEGRKYEFFQTTKSAKALSYNNVADFVIDAALCVEDVSAYFPVGDGTEADPYIITTKQQLFHLKELVDDDASELPDDPSDPGMPMSGKCYKLGCDIDFAGESFEGIGGYYSPFKGKFDGDGYTISNIVLTWHADDPSKNIGFFDHAKNATFRNVTINTNVTIATGYEYVSLFCALADDSSFYNISTEGSIAPAAEDNVCVVRFAGGVVGSLITRGTTFSTLDHCSNDANISVRATRTDARVGGIAGTIYCGTNIFNCVNRGVIKLYQNDTSGDGLSAAGGLIGAISSGTNHNEIILVNRCRNFGSVTNSAYKYAYAGGLFGGVRDATKMTDDYDPIMRVSNFVNKGAVSATSRSGNDAYAGGAVGCLDSIGALACGDSNDHYFYNCLNTGSIYSNGNDARSGGLCGFVYNDETKFVLCGNVGSISGSNDPHNGGISGGCEYGITADGGVACYCFWKKESPELPCIYYDKDGDYDCNTDTYYTSGWINTRRTNFEYINKKFTTNWTNAQWSGTGDISACEWVGDSRYGTLDLYF